MKKLAFIFVLFFLSSCTRATIIHYDGNLKLVPRSVPLVIAQISVMRAKGENDFVLEKRFRLGSGVIIGKKYNTYYLLTAKHAVINADRITVNNNRGEVIKHFDSDISLVKFTSKKWFNVSDIASPIIGQNAWGVGYFMDIGSIGKCFMLKGNVCLIEKDAVWYNGGGFKGISGGPLFNSSHEIIGIASRGIITNRSAHFHIIKFFRVDIIAWEIRYTMFIDSVSLTVDKILSSFSKGI